jgi:hypothetical protein
MKRSELKRKTPLIRKTPIKPMSAKKKQEIADTSAMRAAYVENQGLCDACQVNQACDCHELASGPGRAAAVYLPNTYLALCRPCHTRLQGGPIPPQIVIKWMSVLRDVNACRDGREQFTVADLIDELFRNA